MTPKSPHFPPAPCRAQARPPRPASVRPSSPSSPARAQCWEREGPPGAAPPPPGSKGSAYSELLRTARVLPVSAILTRILVGRGRAVIVIEVETP